MFEVWGDDDAADGGEDPESGEEAPAAGEGEHGEAADDIAEDVENGEEAPGEGEHEEAADDIRLPEHDDYDILLEEMFAEADVLEASDGDEDCEQMPEPESLAARAELEASAEPPAEPESLAKLPAEPEALADDNNVARFLEVEFDAVADDSAGEKVCVIGDDSQQLPDVGQVGLGSTDPDVPGDGIRAAPCSGVVVLPGGEELVKDGFQTLINSIARTPCNSNDEGKTMDVDKGKPKPNEPSKETLRKGMPGHSSSSEPGRELLLARLRAVQQLTPSL